MLLYLQAIIHQQENPAVCTGENQISKNSSSAYVWEYQTPYLVSNKRFAKKGYFFHLLSIDFLSFKNNTKLNKSI